MTYQITYSLNGIGQARLFTGESEGDAIEDFEIWSDQVADSLDHWPEFVSIVEVVK